jgi:hypothetical protein
VSLWLLAVSLFIAKGKEESIWQRERVLLLIFILTAVLHLLFAGVGWFYRYEAYLIAIGILINGTLVFKYFPRLKNAAPNSLYKVPAILSCALALTTLLLLLSRSATAIANTVLASRNIYQQQYQMATFLQRYYSGTAVAANDIGAINFMADIRCLDLYGLGSAEVTRAKLHRQYNTGVMAELTRERGVKIAVVYANWFDAEGGIPQEWTRVGDWITPNCVVCGRDIVTFYAVEPAEVETLMNNLRDFSSALPAEVIQTGRYRENK